MKIYHSLSTKARLLLLKPWNAPSGHVQIPHQLLLCSLSPKAIALPFRPLSFLGSSVKSMGARERAKRAHLEVTAVRPKTEPPHVLQQDIQCGPYFPHQK